MGDLSVYDVMRSKISSLFFAPGQTVSENELSQVMDFPKQSVRQALWKLSQEGLVTIKPLRGSYISKIDQERTLTSIFIIKSLMQAIVRTNPANASQWNSDSITEMRSVISLMVQALKNGDTEEFYRLDNKFHLILSELVSFKRVSNMISSERIHLERVLRLVNRESCDFQAMIDSNVKILTGIENTDPEIFNEGVFQIFRRIEESIDLIKDRYQDYLTDPSRPENKFHLL